MEFNTGCMLIFGLPAEELAAGAKGELKMRLKTEGLCSALGEGGGIGLEVAIHCLGAEPHECVWGVVLESDYVGAVEVDVPALSEKVAWAGETFKKMTGLEGRLFVSADVTFDPADYGTLFPPHDPAHSLINGMPLRAYLAAHAPPVPGDFAPLHKTKVVTTAGGLKQVVPCLEAQADTLVRWRLHYADMMIEALR